MNIYLTIIRFGLLNKAINPFHFSPFHELGESKVETK